MNYLQELTEWVKVQKEKAEKLEKVEGSTTLYHMGKASAFSDVILVAELLLKQQQNSDKQSLLQQTHVMPSLLAFKERRLKLNLSLRDVTKATSVSAATISRIERGNEAEFNNVLKLDRFYASNGA